MTQSPTLASEIAAAGADVTKAKEALKVAEGVFVTLLRERARIDFQVTVGTRVRDKRDVVHIVAEVLANQYDSLRSKPWVKAYPIKKDGNASKTIVNLFGDWELVP